MQQRISVKIVRGGAIIPKYQTKGSAGADLSACIDEPIKIIAGEQAIIPTGIALEIPEGYEVQIRGRSGLAAKYGIGLTNGIGTIDSDYRGEINVILINLGKDSFTIEPGMRIAQMVVAKYEIAELVEVSELNVTERGEGRFGSTGH